MNLALEITPELIAQHGLTAREYDRIVEVLEREPTLAELGVFSVMWSEHCSYKHSRPHLMTLPTTGPSVLHGPGENAGAVDLGDGLACVFKIESHNHPSAVEPHQGAATGVGGILRDVFAMGARPIAVLDALRFGPPSDPHNARIIHGVIGGIADYGNCVGVPTVGGEFSIDPCYTDNCLVNVMAIGLARHEGLMTARAKRAGDLLVYYGNATGRDGVHGATFASQELSDETAESRSSVQVGDPFMEKKILEATLDLVASGRLVALQDMGAAGLTCSSTEMASKGGLGLRLDLDRVPRRAADLSAYELLLSESQERMLAVVAPGELDAVAALLARWDLEAVVVGETTDTGRFVVEFGGVREADIPLRAICDEVLPPDPVAPEPFVPRQVDAADVEIADDAWETLLLDALASPHFASKRWIYEQYDHQVQTNTVVGPGYGAAVLRLPGTERLLAATTDGNGLWCELDPRAGAKLVVAEAARNLVACGAQPLAVTNNLNFGNPRTGKVAWQFAEAVAGMGEACRALGTPVTGGNVSFYNESPRMSVFPTPVIGMIGTIDTRSRLTPGVFQAEGDVVFEVGVPPRHAGGSRVLRDRTGAIVGPSIGIDLAAELQVQRFVAAAIRAGLLTAARSINDGGWLLTVAEMSLASRGGLCYQSGRVDAPLASLQLSEQPSRFVVTTPAEGGDALLAFAASEGLPEAWRPRPMGRVGRGDFRAGNVVLPLARLRAAWETSL